MANNLPKKEFKQVLEKIDSGLSRRVNEPDPHEIRQNWRRLAAAMKKVK